MAKFNDYALESETRETREKYNKNSKLYNFFELPMEYSLFKRWRKRLLKQIREGNVLEVGVGTGKNLPYYPVVKNCVGIDLSEGMLNHAKKFAIKKNVKLVQADAQNLPFRDGYFDMVITTYVFCSVPNPEQGLNEIKRVLKPDGELLMLEHVLPESPLLRKLFNKLNPFILKRKGVNINRETADNIKKTGFDLVNDVNLLFSIFKFFKAKKIR